MSGNFSQQLAHM